MGKTKKFVNDVVEILKGDNAEAIAQKIFKQADSALKTQIASLTGDTIAFEEEVDDAKQALELAKLNQGNVIGAKPENRTQYVANLLIAKNKLTEAEANLEAHKAKLSFLEETFKEINE